MARIIFILVLFQSGTYAQQNFLEVLADSARTLTFDDVRYDGRYISISYPNGDVPADIGVCTDVIIRAYRKVGADLQQLVHEDMKVNFSEYPNLWGLQSTDTNIDHRRVPNLMTYFSRNGNTLKITMNPDDYKPGEIVAWRLPNGLTHIGIVSKQRTHDQSGYMMIHNIGRGQVLEDCLFSFKIIGHYAFIP